MPDFSPALDRAAVADPKRTVDSALEAARELLDMDVAYFSQFTGDEQRIQATDGDAASFGFEPGTEIPLDETLCRRMVEGTVPNVVPDASADERVSHLPSTTESGIGAYVGVPLRLPDGRVYGTLCCASHDARTDLDDRDVAFMRVLARVLGDHLSREARFEAETRWRGELVATLSLWFAAAPHAPAAARTALSALEEDLDGKTAHKLRLLVTELITNSVRHSGVGPAGSVGLDVRIAPDRVRAEVTDPGPGFEPEVRPATPEEDPDRTGGWGYLLVDRLSENWGVEGSGDTTRAWFELGRPG